MEKEPVVASEPVFSAKPSLQVTRHNPPTPSDPCSQVKPVESSGKLTEEQLAAIEDEDVLDKMVFSVLLIILFSFNLTESLNCG